MSILFDPVIHTKEFLIVNSRIALELARSSAEFAVSDLTNDFEILRLANRSGDTVAHLLALYQSQWVNSDASRSFEILKLADKDGWTVAHRLSRCQSEWILSDAAKSFEILKLANIDGLTVAHTFAACQSEWIHSEAAKSFEILKLANIDGLTVAHKLAQHQPEWVHSEAANSLEILKLIDKDGWTVAHKLAQHQPEWVRTEAAKSLEILKLSGEDGLTVSHMFARFQSEWINSEAAKNLEILKGNSKFGSVALYIARNNENCINHESLFQKQVLMLEHQGKSLAEYISRRYQSKGFDLPVIAMKLISQGAAYKHSVPIYFVDGEAILNQSKTLIEDSSEPLIALKQLKALYSTFSHNVAKIISTQDQKSLQKCQGLLLQSENLIRQHLANNPDLYDIEHTIDIFCEPGDGLLKKLKSERVMSSNLTSLNELSPELSSDQTANTQSFY